MKEKALEFSAMVKETVQHAQKQFHGVEEEVQKFVSKVQDRFLNSPMEGAKKVDDLLRTLAVRDFVEKIRAIEMFKQGQAVKKELLDRFGLASGEEVNHLQAQLADLEKKLAAVQNKRPAVARTHFTELKKRVDALEGDKTGTRPSAKKPSRSKSPER